MLSELRDSGAVLQDTFGIWVLFQGLERATFSRQRQGEKSLWEQINKREARRACRCSIHSFKHFSPTPLRWRYSHLLITHILGYISESGAKTKGKLCFIVTTVCLSKHDITLSPPCGTESRWFAVACRLCGVLDWSCLAVGVRSCRFSAISFVVSGQIGL